MARIDFYILPDQAANGRALLACRLAEKAYSLGHQVYIHGESLEQARYLDDLLWTFRQGSFIPHAIYPVTTDEAPPVLIGAGGEPVVMAEVLINFTHEVPTFFERFERVMELVNQDRETLVKSRERFRYYRDRGYPPESHKL